MCAGELGLRSGRARLQAADVLRGPKAHAVPMCIVRARATAHGRRFLPLRPPTRNQTSKRGSGAPQTKPHTAPIAAVPQMRPTSSAPKLAMTAPVEGAALITGYFGGSRGKALNEYGVLIEEQHQLRLTVCRAIRRLKIGDGPRQGAGS